METTHKNEKRWLILGVMCIVLFIISIDNTVLNLALPSIALGFNAAASQLQWVVDAYTLVFASLLITTGAMGDRYGRKRLLIAGLALFGVGSLGAALSTSTNMLIGFRALLGLAGAMIMPSTLSILTNVFRDGRERAKAIAIWSSIFSASQTPFIQTPTPQSCGLRRSRLPQQRWAWRAECFFERSTNPS